MLTGRLDDLGGLVARHAVTGPAMLFVGEVAAFAEYSAEPVRQLREAAA